MHSDSRTRTGTVAVAAVAGIVIGWQARSGTLTDTALAILAAAAAAALLAGFRRHTLSQLERRVSGLEAALRGKDDHLSNTAHELRTPLTTVMASIEMLREGYASTDEERDMFFEQAHAACHHLLFLIDDLLDAAATEAGKLRIEPKTCFTRRLLEDAQRILAPVAVVRNMGLDVLLPEDDVVVQGDPNRVLQVLFNMVGNALKYAPPRSEVVLRATAEDTGVLFEVLDEGIGVPTAQRPSLFQRFARLHDPAHSSESGTGIGLHLSKVLVERMGGQIGYRERTDGPGSVFWFRLPRAAPAAAQPTEPPPAGARQRAVPALGPDDENV